MAGAGEIEVKVTIEQSIHAVLKELAEKYAKEHGIYINSVQFDWLKSQPMGGVPTQKVRDISMISESLY